MTLRRFGAADFQVSALGLGTSHIASLTTPHSPSRMARLLDDAYDAGIRFFDTADVYGQGDAERLLAKTAAKEGTVICTKAGLGVGALQPVIRLAKPFVRPILARSAGLRQRTSSVRKAQEQLSLEPEQLEHKLKNSLRRLKRDHVEIFLLHSPPLSALADGRLYDVLDDLRHQGLARSVGVSVQHLDDAMPVIASGRVDALQVPINAQTLTGAQSMLQAAHQAGVGVIAREVLSGASHAPDALRCMLSDPQLPVNLVGTTSDKHLAANAALMKSASSAS